MKIGILTLYYKNHNFGGQLQAYALCRYFNRLEDINCEQIAYDYKRKEEKSIKRLIFSMYSYVFHPKVMIGLKKRKRKFETFEKAIPHSAVVSSSEGLTRVVEKYDYVFTGSDQVWNPEYAGGVFYLNTVPESKRCAYAASFGKDCLDEDVLTDEILHTLKNYKFMTVREITAKRILEQRGIEDVDVVCDPTFLIEKEEWENQITQINRIVQGKYVFVYLLGNSKSLRDDIKKKFGCMNLKIVSIPHIHFSYQKRDKGFADIEAYNVGPLEFLRLIYDAEIVVTDSFHCTLFSILFNKNFWTLSRNGTYDRGSTNGRIYTLLEKTGMMDRYAGTVSKIRVTDKYSHDNSASAIVEFSIYSKKLLADFLLKSRMNG